MLWEVFALKNEVITANIPKITVSAEITVQQYKLERKFTVVLDRVVRTLFIPIC